MKAALKNEIQLLLLSLTLYSGFTTHIVHQPFALDQKDVDFIKKKKMKRMWILIMKTMFSYIFWACQCLL